MAAYSVIVLIDTKRLNDAKGAEGGNGARKEESEKDWDWEEAWLWTHPPRTVSHALAPPSGKVMGWGGSEWSDAWRGFWAESCWHFSLSGGVWETGREWSVAVEEREVMEGGREGGGVI